MKTNNVILATEGANYQVYYNLDDHSDVVIIRETMKGFHARVLKDGVVTSKWIDITNELMEGLDCQLISVNSYWSTHTDPTDIKNLQWKINHGHMTPAHVGHRIALNHRPKVGA